MLGCNHRDFINKRLALRNLLKPLFNALRDEQYEAARYQRNSAEIGPLDLAGHETPWQDIQSLQDPNDAKK